MMVTTISTVMLMMLMMMAYLKFCRELVKTLCCSRFVSIVAVDEIAFVVVDVVIVVVVHVAVVYVVAVKAANVTDMLINEMRCLNFQLKIQYNVII